LWYQNEAETNEYTSFFETEPMLSLCASVSIQ